MERKPSPFVLCADCNPLPGDEVIGFHADDGKIYVHKCGCPQAVSLSAQQGDIIESVDISSLTTERYPVSLSIKSVDRDGFLLDLIDVISNQLRLSIKRIDSDTRDDIVTCRLDLYVHSTDELNTAEERIKQMRDIYEVKLLGHRLF